MSTINTNGLDVNYPIPGQNNSSQGFRNNFTNIKQNLDIAAGEISDLQNKVVLKSALANSTLNNDMANTLIANASTLQFRGTTYNLGNSLANAVVVDCSLGDLQFGTLAGNVVLQFGSWAPVDTLGTVKLQLNRPNAEVNYSITLPSEATFSQSSGWALVENSSNANGNTTLTFPYDATQLNLTLTSTDCGETIFAEPTNRPFKTTQIQNRTPLPQGSPGDTVGTVCVDTNYLYVCTSNYVNNNPSSDYTAVATFSSNNKIIINSAVDVSFENRPVIFSEMEIGGAPVSTFGNIISGQVYYVKSIESILGGDSALTISENRIGGLASSTLALTTVAEGTGTSMTAVFYNGTSIWKRVGLSSNW